MREFVLVDLETGEHLTNIKLEDDEDLCICKLGDIKQIGINE